MRLSKLIIFYRFVMRGGEVVYLVGLISQRTFVRIKPDATNLLLMKKNWPIASMSAFSILIHLLDLLLLPLDLLIDILRVLYTLVDPVVHGRLGFDLGGVILNSNSK